MDPNDYTMVWSAYGAGATVVVALLWSLTRGGNWLNIKWAFRLLCVAAVATPIYHSDATQQFVPAIVTATLGGMLGGVEEAMPAWRLLGLSAALALLAAIPMARLEAAIRRRFGSNVPDSELSATAHSADPAGD